MRNTSLACLWAASTAALAETETQTLPPVVITATRTAQSADETLASVTVITREEIDRRQVLSLPEVLRGVPGLNMGNSGGLGKDTSVFMRGTNASHVLVLIDGIRVGSATTGTAAFQDIPVDQIERIEIVRGPRSSLYGSEAIGGVVQIFTRKGGGDFKPQFSAGLGTYDTYKVIGGLSGGGERGWYNLSGGELYTRGINACRGSDDAGCFTHESDKDGYENTHGSARAGYRFDNGLEVDGNLLHAEGRNDFDQAEGFDFTTFRPIESAHNYSRTVQQVLGGGLKYSPWDFWVINLKAGRNLDESRNFAGTAKDSFFKSDRVFTTLQNDFTVTKDHSISLGFDYYVDQLDSNIRYQVNSRDNKAGFAQYRGSWQALDWVMAVRHDHNQQFGGYTTGNVGVGYAFAPQFRLNASWGRAFKAPSFNELYWPPSFGFSGNPNLQPEQSQSWELGAGGDISSVHWAVNGYHTEVQDMITFDFRAGMPLNVAQAEILGLETQLSTDILGFEVAANLTVQDPLNQEPGPRNGKLLNRRPQQMMRFDVDRRLGPVKLGLTVNQEGRRFEDLDNRIRLGGFTTLDLRASYQFHPGWTLEGRCNNLFNEHYETAYLYNQMGTNLFLSLNYRPEK